MNENVTNLMQINHHRLYYGPEISRPEALLWIDYRRNLAMHRFPNGSESILVDWNAVIENRDFDNQKFVDNKFVELLVQAHRNPDTHYLIILKNFDPSQFQTLDFNLNDLLARQANGQSQNQITDSKWIATWKALTGLDTIYLPNNLSIWAAFNSDYINLNQTSLANWDVKTIDFDDQYTREIFNKANPMVFGNNQLSWIPFVDTVNETLMSINPEKLKDKRLYPLSSFIEYRSDHSNLNAPVDEALTTFVIPYLWNLLQINDPNNHSQIFKTTNGSLTDNDLNQLLNKLNDDNVTLNDVFTNEFLIKYQINLDLYQSQLQLEQDQSENYLLNDAYEDVYEDDEDFELTFEIMNFSFDKNNNLVINNDFNHNHSKVDQNLKPRQTNYKRRWNSRR